MGISSLLGSLLKGKILAVVLVSTVLVGGATAAATPAGQNIVRTVMSAKDTTSTGQKAEQAQQQDKSQGNGKANQSSAHTNNNGCPGLSEAQNLAAMFSLSTDSKSDDIQAICALHQGNFTGTTPGGAMVTSNHVLGYGEISDLLTLATKTSRLTNANARSLLAAALQSCGTMPVMACVKSKAPGVQPGNDHNNGGKGAGGKPESTPTPPVHH